MKFSVKFGVVPTRPASRAYEVGDVIVSGSQRLVVVNVGLAGMLLRNEARLWPQTEPCALPTPAQAPKNKPWFRQFQRSRW